MRETTLVHFHPASSPICSHLRVTPLSKAGSSRQRCVESVSYHIGRAADIIPTYGAGCAGPILVFDDDGGGGEPGGLRLGDPDPLTFVPTSVVNKSAAAAIDLLL